MFLYYSLFTCRSVRNKHLLFFYYPVFFLRPPCVDVPKALDGSKCRKHPRWAFRFYTIAHRILNFSFKNNNETTTLRLQTKFNLKQKNGQTTIFFPPSIVSLTYSPQENFHIIILTFIILTKRFTHPLAQCKTIKYLKFQESLVTYIFYIPPINFRLTTKVTICVRNLHQFFVPPLYHTCLYIHFAIAVSTLRRAVRIINASKYITIWDDTCH